MMRLGFLNGNTIRSSDDDSRAHVAEKPVVDNSTNILDISSHLSWVLNSFFKMKVDDVISVVSYSDFIAVIDVGRGGSHSKDGLAALARWKGSNFSHGVFMAERSDFHRNWEARSEAVSKLRFVNYQHQQKLEQ